MGEIAGVVSKIGTAIFDDCREPWDQSCIETSAIEAAHRLGARAGSLGVRGLIEIRLGESAELVATEDAVNPFIEPTIRQLREEGVRRLHLIFPPDRSLEEIALRHGFIKPAGEFLHERILGSESLAAPILPHGYSLRSGVQADIWRLNGLIAAYGELAFMGWEPPLVAQGIGNPNRFFKVLELEGQIVGLSIGGSVGDRGTISHLWVHPEHQKRDLGTALSNASLQALSSAGATRIYLITVQGNEGARAFWAKQGFTVSTTNIFYEQDL